MCIRDSDNTDNIIGVISANPVVVGDSASERWKEKWITDDFGDPVYEEYTITEWYDETKKEKVNYATDRIPSDVTVGVGSSVLSTDHKGNAFTIKKLNPSWDSTANYIPRKDRKDLMTVVTLFDVLNTCEHWFLPYQEHRSPMELL